MQVVERAAPLDRDAHTAEAVVVDGGGRAVRHLLFVVAKESVCSGRSTNLLDPPAIYLIPVLLDHVAVVVLHLRQPVLCVPH